MTILLRHGKGGSVGGAVPAGRLRVGGGGGGGGGGEGKHHLHRQSTS